ncbi:MAG: hypothetical protein ACK5H1_09165 [Tenacibaculum sp.]
MWRRFNFSLALLYTCTLLGQNAVKGILKSKFNNQPITYANIIVSNTGNSPQPLAYGYSDEQGAFFIEIPTNASEISMNITSIGFQEKTIVVQLPIKEALTIYMEQSNNQLKEVEVKAKKVKDTLDLKIDEMNLTDDSSLRDILDKTDGLIIGDKGGISYQGKQINKILINGKEVFINQNKIALDNLNYEIMENVQIINNYKDKFAIDFKRIRDPVINIDTKAKFKGVLKGQFNLGYGIKNNYNTKAKGFFFSDVFNAFALSNTNNIGEKELSSKDISAPLRKYSTANLNSNLYSYFIDDDKTEKNFVSNTSLTIRNQGDNSKTGLVLNHGNIHVKKQTDILLYTDDSLLRKSQLRNTNKGYFASFTANYSRVLSEKAVLQNVLNSTIIRQQKSDFKTDSLFVPQKSLLVEDNLQTPKAFSFSNALKLTRLLNEKIAFDLLWDYYCEKVLSNDDIRLKNIAGLSIFQRNPFSKNFQFVQGELKFRLKKAVLNTGIGLAKNEELSSLEYENNTNIDKNLKRKLLSLNAFVLLNGTYKKLDYNFSVKPTLIYLKKSANRKLLKMNHSLTYRFLEQNTLRVGFSRNYTFYNLNELHDTVVKAYNYRLINAKVNTEGFSINNKLTLAWFNNNVARTKSSHFDYSYIRQNNSLQSVLDSISNNIFYYKSRVFNLSQSHNFSLGGKKGYYITDSYHLFRMGAKLDFEANKYTTILNKQTALVRSKFWKPIFKLSFLPRNKFIGEFSNQLKWNLFTIDIDKNKTSNNAVFTNTFYIKGAGDKLNWSFELFYINNSVDKERFCFFDSNLSVKYQYSEKISFSLRGKSLLTLFNLNNYNYTNILSEGNTLRQINTSNNLSYLIFYTSFSL